MASNVSVSHHIKALPPAICQQQCQLLLADVRYALAREYVATSSPPRQYRQEHR